MGSNSGSGCHSGGIWGGVPLLDCGGFRAGRALGAWGVALSFSRCPAVFASVVSCLIGVGLGACRVVVMSVLPGFLALGWSVSGVVFSHYFVWAWLCFQPEVPFKEGEVVANCFQIFRLVVLYFQMY